MCEYCLEHGDGEGRSWYLNAKNYADELVEKYGLREFLLEQYKNFEQMAVRPQFGLSPVGMDYAFKMPLIGRMARWMADRMLLSRRPAADPLTAEGHIGQVITLEHGIAILEKCAVEPIVQKNCMCRFMSRGYKEACCINFGVMSEILSQLPRFIPENEKFQLTRSEAIARFTEHNRKGYVGTIWFGPYPYVNNLCSCANPECAGLRPRLDFGIRSVLKGEYVIELNEELCTRCRACVKKCQFKALRHDPKKDRIAVDQTACYGCGVCRHACEREALRLKPREQVRSVAGKY